MGAVVVELPSRVHVLVLAPCHSFPTAAHLHHMSEQGSRVRIYTCHYYCRVIMALT